MPVDPARFVAKVLKTASGKVGMQVKQIGTVLVVAFLAFDIQRWILPSGCEHLVQDKAVLTQHSGKLIKCLTGANRRHYNLPYFY